jgi:hypothetical protein
LGISHPFADLIADIDGGKYLIWKTTYDIAEPTQFVRLIALDEAVLSDEGSHLRRFSHRPYEDARARCR